MNAHRRRRRRRARGGRVAHLLELLSVRRRRAPLDITLAAVIAGALVAFAFVVAFGGLR